MNNPLDPTLRELNDCGCCAGRGTQTPAAIDNRPGLPAIRFRAGVHAQFTATLLAALSSRTHPDLRKLRTRDHDDFTIALLDAMASAADVLTFYSERIANEAYLRTATERRSVRELARAIGCQLDPGVAARVMLSFTIEGGAGAPGTAIIPQGTKAQSIPGPGEKPQVFETSVEFHARAAWNELRPRMTRPQPLDPNAAFLFLKGTATNLKLGDVLVLSAGSATVVRQVGLLTVDRERDFTRVDFSATPAEVPRYQPPPLRAPTPSFSVAAPGTTAWESLFGAGTAFSRSATQHALHYGGFDMAQVTDYMRQPPPAVPLGPSEGAFVLRQRLGCFGHNAPKWATLPKTDSTRGNAYVNDWDNLDAGEVRIVAQVPRLTTIWQDSQGTPYNPPLDKDIYDSKSADIYLERSAPEVVKGSWIVLDSADQRLIAYRVAEVSETSLADYGLSGKATGLALLSSAGTKLVDNDRLKGFTTRSTTVHVQSERLELADVPIDDDLVIDQVEIPLDRLDFDLCQGQSLALTGIGTDPAGVRLKELLEIADLRHGDRVTTVTLRTGLQYGYRRATATLNGNVVPATHGETTREVLGSGDATQPFQRFTLKQQPLTYTFPPDRPLREASLEIWVDNVKWREAPTFFGSGPKDRVYLVRRADNGVVTVAFGDGKNGARLPTGRENVRAVYRKGIGREGIVKEDQIKLLLTQPLGVTGVSNLLSPAGAEDPQTLDDARRNAPRTVLTLDRIVSLQDYEDYARDYPGIDRAHAVWAWIGRTRGVLLTLLGPNGAEIGDTGQPADPLRAALADLGNARVPVRIVTRRPSLFAVAGTVRVEADRLPSVVEAALRAALLAAFSFAARELGQGVHLSEVYVVMQSVAGVAFVDLDAVGFSKTAHAADGTLTMTISTNGYLRAHQPLNGTDALQAEPAELLILDESSLSQVVVTAR